MGTYTFLMRFPYQLILLSSPATYHCLVVKSDAVTFGIGWFSVLRYAVQSPPTAICRDWSSALPSCMERDSRTNLSKEGESVREELEEKYKWVLVRF